MARRPCSLTQLAAGVHNVCPVCKHAESYGHWGTIKTDALIMPDGGWRSEWWGLRTHHFRAGACPIFSGLSGPEHLLRMPQTPMCKGILHFTLHFEEWLGFSLIWGKGSFSLLSPIKTFMALEVPICKGLSTSVDRSGFIPHILPVTTWTRLHKTFHFNETQPVNRSRLSFAGRDGPAQDRYLESQTNGHVRGELGNPARASLTHCCCQQAGLGCRKALP